MRFYSNGVLAPKNSILAMTFDSPAEMYALIVNAQQSLAAGHGAIVLSDTPDHTDEQCFAVSDEMQEAIKKEADPEFRTFSPKGESFTDTIDKIINQYGMSTKIETAPEDIPSSFSDDEQK